MATVISVIGTAVTILGFLLDNVPDGPNQAKVSYIIANDGAHGDLTGAGGNLPDVRLFDETAEYLAGNFDGNGCPEGYTTCTSDVNTQEAPTYTLFSGNDDAICIAWTGLAWAGGQKKYGFHPGNWAYACDRNPWNSGGHWYYAGTKVPGIDNDEDVFCAWVDKNGDVPTTGFQVHWPEFDGDESAQQSLDYYCNNNPPVEYREDYDPNTIAYWIQKRNASPLAKPADAAPVSTRDTASLMAKFKSDPRLIKSHFAKHTATDLCDASRKAAGQSFVSYAEQKFCYMPTKTLYDFCANVEDGACWSDDTNEVTAKGSDSGRLALPDMSHIEEVVVWGT